ncbi:hypothetical protein A9168_08915 [Macellibacteroides sp. HH-ZS]|nr:hypothetical protein A9168_08915 [Macellibacteroides sp. HH-ZS]
MNNNIIQKLESLKITDPNGKSFWSSRDLYQTLGYSSYQKFSELIKRSIDKAKKCGYFDNDLFNLKVEMVQIGSGAIRPQENFHLTRIACRFIIEYADRKKTQVIAAKPYFSEDKDGVDCDINSNISFSFDEKESIKARNKHYWKLMTDKASQVYKNKMHRLAEGIKKNEVILTDFCRDDSFLGSPAKHHIIYKLGKPLVSEDGLRAYEFLVEYDIFEPNVGIYYGCKGFTLNGNHDIQIDKFIEEWKEIEAKLAEVLSNTFPGKRFDLRFRQTDNANNNTYWPFWVTLYEEEDIVCVAARATHIIRKSYKDQFMLHNITEFTKLGIINNTQKEPKDYNVEEDYTFCTKTAFTYEAYESLLDKLGNETNKETFKRLIDNLMKKPMMPMLETISVYEKAYAINFSGTDFAYLILAFFNYLKNDLNTFSGRIPWEAISCVFLNMDKKKFGKDTLKNSMKDYSKNRDERISEAREIMLKFI